MAFSRERPQLLAICGPEPDFNVAGAGISLANENSRLVRLRSRNIKELDSSAMSVVQEVLGFIRTIKAFGQEHGFPRMNTNQNSRFVRFAARFLPYQSAFCENAKKRENLWGSLSFTIRRIHFCLQVVTACSAW